MNSYVVIIGYSDISWILVKSLASRIIYIYIYIYIYILKRHYKDIEESILHKRMMVKERIIYIDIYENLKSPYISILTC